MTSSLRNSTAIVFLCVALLFYNEHIVEGDGDFCEVPSALFQGACFDISDDCDSNCKDFEGAVSGRCRDYKCYCTRRCQDNICTKLSGTFRGPCLGGLSNMDCFKTCKNEAAIGGRCNDFKCTCIFSC